MPEYRKQEFGNVGGWETGILGVLSSLFGLLFKSGDSGDRVVTTISEIERPSPEEMLERWEAQQAEAIRPELSEAFEAVRGQIFGPVDAVTVKLKHGEMIQTAKEKREFEQGLRDLVPGTREHREDRDRRDRQDQMRTLSWLLANDRAYRAAHEKALAAFAGAGNAIEGAIEAGEEALSDVKEKIDDYLASTPRLKDGRYVMFDAKDGRYKDQSFVAINEADLVGVDKEAVKPILPYERMMEWKDKISKELDKQRGRLNEVGEWQNEATDKKNPTKLDQLEERTERSSEYEKDAGELQKMLSETPDYFGAKLVDERSSDASMGIDEPAVLTATMAMPPMP